MDSRKRVGSMGERMAVNYLKERGYEILYAPWKKLPFGEIDIIARKDGRLIFVEVKLRRSARYGRPEEAVHAAKRWKLSRLIALFLSAHQATRRPYQLDVIAIEFSGGTANIRHVEHVSLDG